MNSQYDINSSSTAVTPRAIAAPTFISKLGQRYRWLPSEIILVFVTIGMVISQCAGTIISGDDTGGVWAYVFFIGFLLLTIVPGIFLMVQPSWMRRILPIDILLVVLILSGLPGMMMSLPSDTEPSSRLIFLPLLAYRCFLLFVLVPRTMPNYKDLFEKAVLTAYFVSSAIAVLGTILFMGKTGYDPLSAIRLGSRDQGWLVANTIGYYAGTCLLACALASFIPKWIRFIVGITALAELIFTQSRTPMIALLLVLIMNYFMYAYGRGQAKRFLAYAVPVLLILGGIAVAAFPVIEQTRIVQSLILRSQSSQLADPTAGRGDDIKDALNLLSNSPLFGYGYRTTLVHVDNGYIDMGAEMGIIGTILYFVFCAVTVGHGIRLVREKNNQHYQDTGRYLICFVSFMFIHAIAEKSHGLKISDISANAWLLLSGYAVCLPSKTTHKAEVDT